MKFLWMRVMDWVKWRWTLPVHFKAAQRSAEYWKARCDKAESAPSWKLEYGRELARSKETQRQLEEALAQRKALMSGMTASGLSAAEVERLALLAMAAGKLAAEAAKVILHGWGSPSPGTGRPAYTDVERGMGRVAAAAEVMVEAGDVRGGDVRAHAGRAKQRISGSAQAAR